jgi:hypothetical protein
MVANTAMHRGVGIRSYTEIWRRSEKASRTLNWLAGQVETQFNQSVQDYQFLAGAKRLSQLKQKLGHMSEGRRIALAGVLEQKISWLLVHSGHARSAVSHASQSLWLLQTAYYRLDRKDDAREFIKSALIASQANLLASRPAAAIQILDLIGDASATIGTQIGSEFYRQRGVALFQLGSKHDDEANKCFEQAGVQMKRLGEASSEAQVLMTSARHMSLLHRPNWDKAMKVSEAVQDIFGPESLESSMIRHWTAACGLLTDDHLLRREAREFVEKNKPVASRFGHQATISKLLSITPELGLPKGLQAVWIRKALYQNAFRFK